MDLQGSGSLPRVPKEEFTDLSELNVKKSLVQFMSLDEDQDFVIFRKFKKLTLYMLLEKQDQLRKIENMILDWEQRSWKEQPALLPALSDGLRTANTLLKEYHELLLLQRQVMRLPPPPERLLEYLRINAQTKLNEWVPILRGHGSDDMISLSETEKGFIHQYIRKEPRLERLFVEKRDYGSRFSDMSFYSEGRARRVETLVITIGFCLLVLGPIAALSYLEQIWLKLLIIAVGIILTSVITSGLSENAHRGSLAVIAGYTAILAVFLGSNVEQRI